MRMLLIATGVMGLAGCDGEPPQTPTGRQVVTSGKAPAALGQVPEAVLASARGAQPSMRFLEAAAETRDGRNYYDIEGELPDGSEIELDLMEENGVWRVVETQRDIAFAATPEAVRAKFATANAGFTPVRVIESRQADGPIIYELFGPGQNGAEGRKIEVKVDGANVELLTEEWAH